MKKKNLVAKGMAMLMACALVVGNTGIVAHAYVADDGTVHSDREAGGGGGASLNTGSSNSGGSSSGSSNSGGGSSYDDGCVRSDREAGGGGSASLDSSTASAPKAAGTEASAGKEKFRALANAGAGTYKVTHKGIEIATFKLMDADKKNVSCTAITFKQRDDKKYAIDFQIADAKGLTIGAPVDRTYMYNTLGVSYVTINDEIVIDIEAEAAAKTAK